MVTISLIPTILSGGSGSRLWPVSRELHPKPFIRLTDGQSLLQKTFLRATALNGVKEIVTVTHRELFFKTEDEYRELQQEGVKLSFILEPFGRNTTAAIASAALHIARTWGGEALMLILPADHLVANESAFFIAIEQAQLLAQQGKLVTFGIPPQHPETGYGYIEAEGNSVRRFVEKPSFEQAEEYLQRGFLWNSGMFCFTVQTILSQLEFHCSEILLNTKRCIELSRIATGKEFVQVELDPVSFREVPNVSIDCGLIEKSLNVAVVPCDIGWSDIGTWGALGNLTHPDVQGNRIEGEALLHEVSDCYIRSANRVIGAVGLNNLFIIDTPDALLVADKSKAQDVKLLYEKLKERAHETYKLHRTVHRPWGSYTVLEEGKNFKIKRIEVRPKASLSLQMHYHRSEHWIVVIGMAKVTNGEQEIFVNTNESTYIPAGHKHRLENPGIIPLVMIEVQSGEYMGEDDIVRFEDIYGRSENTVS